LSEKERRGGRRRCVNRGKKIRVDVEEEGDTWKIRKGNERRRCRNVTKENNTRYGRRKTTE
jgi:hypothetical protein